jgi:four helix bundle protein
MARFVQIAMGSGAELSYHLLLSRGLGLLNTSKYSQLSSDLSEIMRMLSSLLQKLRKAVATQVSS